MLEAQMNREAVLVIAELMWALRRSGAHTFFPDMPLHKARKLVLVGAAVGLAHLRGRPVTLASLSRQLEMPHATTERRLKQLIQAGWVYRRGTRYFVRLERLEEPAYAQKGNLSLPGCVTPHPGRKLMTTKRIFPWVLAVSKRLLRQMSTTTTSRFLSEYDRATLRSTQGTDPADCPT